MNSLLETSIKAAGLPEVFLSFVIITLLVHTALQTRTVSPQSNPDAESASYGSASKLGLLGLGLTGVLQASGSPTVGGLGSIGFLVISAAFIVLIIALPQPLRARGTATHKSMPEGYTVLVLLATLGMLILISAKDLIVLYLAIELISLSLYVMAATGPIAGGLAAFSTEAGLRYFILGALSSGVLLFGCSLIYVVTGQTGYEEIANFLAAADSINDPNGAVGLPGLRIPAIFVLTAILFKLAAAPFHMWAPDVYEGSPTVVTAFFAAVPKVAIFSALVTLAFGPFYAVFDSTLQPLLFLSALMSVIVGSIGALNQIRIKRLLAYSAIGHMGFLLLGLATGTVSSLHGALVYFVLYIIMTVNSFAFILAISPRSSRETLLISQLTGISRTHPVLAISFTMTLLSLAGIPPLAGFLSKYLVLNQAVANGWYLVALVAILFSVVGCYYYVRIIQLMFFKNPHHQGGLSGRDYKDLSALALSRANGQALPQVNIASAGDPVGIVLGGSLFIILTALLYPNPVLTMATDAFMGALI